ncbi:MAG: tyrosine-protein kinase family protein [Terriglobia bacterium]
MSRIHDALKKAEQERTGVPQPDLGPKAAAVSPAASGIAENERPVDAGVGVLPAVLEPAPFSGPLTMETLLARCPVLPWRPDPGRVLPGSAQGVSLGSEEFRTLRSKLYQSRDTKPLRTVLITSALPQEGKTFIAANLAQAIVRQRERRALLIDADLRWSRLHMSLGTRLSPGLTEYLRGEADELSILQRGPVENLFFIPGGRQASNAAELIANGRLQTLLARLGPIFDWVILDSPPAVAMSDASLMADICDGVLLVVSAGQTPFDMAQKAREIFRQKHLLGVVLNRVQPGSADSRYYYGYYDKSGGKKKSKR